MENNKVLINIVSTLFLIALTGLFIYILAKHRRPKEGTEIPVSQFEQCLKKQIVLKKLSEDMPVGSFETEESFVKTYKIASQDSANKISTLMLDGKAKVIYKYNISLTEDWSFLQVNNILRVVVPEIKASIPTYEKSSLKINWAGNSGKQPESAKMDEFRTDFETYINEKATETLYRNAILEKARAEIVMFLAEMLNSQNFPINCLHVKFRNEEKFPKFPYAINPERISFAPKP